MDDTPKKSRSKKEINLDKIDSMSIVEDNFINIDGAQFNTNRSSDTSFNLSDEEKEIKKNSMHDSDSINRSSDYTLDEDDLFDSDDNLDEEMLTTLVEGQYFGTSTMTKDGTVKAPVTTYAAKKCHLLVIDGKALHDLKFKCEERIKYDHFDFMREIYLFQKLSRGRVHKLKEEFEI